MRLLICVPLLLTACSADKHDRSQGAPIQAVGKLQNSKIDEASGLARSGRNANILWVINDSGPPVVHAIDLSGNERGRVEVVDASNGDWEDLASFQYQGQPYLLIADIGDNEARRKDVTLYVIAEPNPDDDEIDIAWRIDFHYPAGPRDAEALAVDAVNGRIYVLSKREVPAVLYQLPLRPAGEETIIAKRIAAMDNLPQPSKAQLRDAAGSGYAWQPTGMDFSSDGRAALILTYQGIYYLARRNGQPWPVALSGRPVGLSLGNIQQAESVAFARESGAAFVTVEKQHASLFKVDLSSATLDPL